LLLTFGAAFFLHDSFWIFRLDYYVVGVETRFYRSLPEGRPDWVFAGRSFFLSRRRVGVGVSRLSLLATVRGGTSFLFPTAKKKRSKENAYKRQPVGVSLAQPRPWPENRTVPADQPVVEHPSCLMRHRTLRPHGRNAGRTGLVSSRSGTHSRLHKPFTTSILFHAALHAAGTWS
jgi:hypothetical protein